MDVNFIFSIVILIFSVILHEISHGYAAEMQGDPTARIQGRLTLNPLRHIDPLGSIIVPFLSYISGGFLVGWAKPVPFNPYNLRNQRWGEAIVAVAGPLMNIAIALIFGLFIRSYPIATLPFGIVNLIGSIVIINLVLAIFNLVPIPPLDGSKILFALFPNRLSPLRATLERNSFILILILIFFLWQWIVPLVFWLFTLITGLA
jgi:Zn-dependent protease